MSEPTPYTWVWVFTGGGTFPSGIFSTRQNAEAWIREHRLNGCLTRYPLDVGAYEWAVREGYFVPKRDEQITPDYVARFACGHEHYHYESGELG